jgi:hypothetical protein
VVARPLSSASLWGLTLQADQRGIPANSARSGQPPGNVISVRSSRVSVGLPLASMSGADEARPTVGKFLGIQAGKALLIGVITDVTLAAEHGYNGIAHLDLVGEVKDAGTALARFQRGVAEYPAIGDPVAPIGTRERRLIFNIRGSSVIDIGHLHQDGTVGAYIDVNDMLSKHFAVLGTTGVGKSSGVVLILQEAMRARPDLRIFVLDPHNEYGRCFGDRALLINPRNLKLPFWLDDTESAQALNCKTGPLG